MAEACKMKHEQEMHSKIVNNQVEKSQMIRKVEKIISKKEMEVLRLSAIEAEVRRKVRDTHQRQQEVIEQI